MSNKNRIKIMLVLLVSIYLFGAFFYENKFMPRTYLNDKPIGGKTLLNANGALSNQDKWEGLELKNGKEIFIKIEPDQVIYEYVESSELFNQINSQSNWKWFMYLFSKRNYDIEPTYIYNRKLVENIIIKIPELSQELNNAELIYVDDKGKFEISNHQSKLNITKDELIALINKSIKNRDSTLELKEYVKEPAVLSNNEDLIELRNDANEYLKIELKYAFGEDVETIDKSLIKDWVSSEGLDIKFDKDKIREYVISNLSKYDTRGKTRNFKTTSGKVINVPNGSYGWLIHRSQTVESIIEHIKSKESKEIEPIYSYKAVTRGKNDIGNSYVEIDIDNQMVYVYSKGELKVKTPTVTGNVSKGHSTPKNRIDALTYKTTNTVLRGPGYASPVKYWMPFNGGIGLHDADWRSSFGGQIYKTNGSHGCINLPPSVAENVYKLVFQGMPVIVY